MMSCRRLKYAAFCITKNIQHTAIVTIAIHAATWKLAGNSGRAAEPYCLSFLRPSVSPSMTWKGAVGEAGGTTKGDLQFGQPIVCSAADAWTMTGALQRGQNVWSDMVGPK
ncbi:hypothetical protein PX52LOC_06936 [Limnoglobus roseus]|uniref:Uncharacterized protein n=1 Tax=Limnoglobus roseus TaxID=2598579 RepID=A0A5C1AMP5_9BACT|nr:hypothetical protein PX52LOC_06936 [Limnoglobus roseus]